MVVSASDCVDGQLAATYIRRSNHHTVCDPALSVLTLLGIVVGVFQN